MIKVVEVIPTFFPVGGAERFVSNLIIQFSKHEDVSVEVISLYNNSDNDIVRKINNFGIKIHFLNKKRGIDFKCAREFRKVVNSIKPDIIHLHLNTLLTYYLSAVSKRIKTFYTFHTLINKNVVGRKNKPINLLTKFLLKTGKIRAVAISNVIKQSICSYYSLKNKYVETIPNGVPLDSIDYSIPSQKRKFDLIFVGRFIELKNVQLIASSFAKIKQSFSKNNLVMLGDGPLLEKCKSDYSNFIHFTGFVDNACSYIENSKVLVLASKYEGNPIVVNEAIAAGTFVVSTCVGGIPDILNETTGLLLPKETNASDLCASLIRVLNDINKISDAIMLNIEKNRENVSIAKTADKYLYIFKKI